MSRRVGVWAARVTAALLLIILLVLAVGAVTGHRLVVLTSASMAPAAPAGALLVVHPVAAAEVRPGDVLVMNHGGGPPVTHRVVEVRAGTDGLEVITKGDANARVDLDAYPLTEHNLVARWTLPGVGGLLVGHRHSVVMVGLAAAATAVLIAAAVTVRRLLSVNP